MQLQVLKRMKSNSDFAMLWKYSLFWERVRDQAFENLMKINKEMTRNRHLYPANDVANAGRNIAVGPSKFSLVYSSTVLLSKIQKEHELVYNDIVEPFSELFSEDMKQLTRTGTLSIGIDEPWNQERADETISELDKLGDVCVVIMKNMINLGASSTGIAEEIHRAASDLGLY